MTISKLSVSYFITLEDLIADFHLRRVAGLCFTAGSESVRVKGLLQHQSSEATTTKGTGVQTSFSLNLCPKGSRQWDTESAPE